MFRKFESNSAGNLEDTLRHPAPGDISIVKLALEKYRSKRKERDEIEKAQISFKKHVLNQDEMAQLKLLNGQLIPCIQEKKKERESLQTLLSHMNFDVQQASHRAFLVRLVFSTKPDIFSLALDKIDINAVMDDEGNNLLLLAIQKNKFLIVEYLIKKGADVARTNGKKKTILHYFTNAIYASELTPIHKVF